MLFSQVFMFIANCAYCLHAYVLADSLTSHQWLANDFVLVMYPHSQYFVLFVSYFIRRLSANAGATVTGGLTVSGGVAIADSLEVVTGGDCDPFAGLIATALLLRVVPSSTMAPPSTAAWQLLLAV